MNIAIVGAGQVGATLARKLAQAGHGVSLANSRGPDTLVALAAQTGAKAASVHDALQGAEVVILSVPFGGVPRLRAPLDALPAHVVVADTSNYFPVRDGWIGAIDRGQVESVWVSEQIGRPVVKAWNNALAHILAVGGRPAGAAGRIALSVAGDDAAAKRVVMSLVETTGFDAIDGGPLAESWRQQPITAAYCAELGADALRVALARADRARAPLLREEMVQAYVALGERDHHRGHPAPAPTRERLGVTGT